MDYLIAGRLGKCFTSLIIYCSLRFASSLFKELQSLVYMKVKQQASIQLAEKTFTHLHALSLTWHLNKKMGNVIRSMDRGTEAANTLVNYLFLFLAPALLECLAVCILFFVKFNSVYLGCVVIVGVVVYSLATVAITNWRKKFRYVYYHILVFTIILAAGRPVTSTITSITRRPLTPWLITKR